MLSTREKVKAGNSLICLLRALEGRRTTVELRNESRAEGRVEHVDGFMNVRMASVRLSGPAGRPSQHLDRLFVLGPQIRYVHIPDDVDIVTAMQQQLVRIGLAEPTGTRPGGRGRGQGRGGGRRTKPPTRRPQQPP